MNFNNRQTGVTIIELVVVLVVVGAMTALAMPTLTGTTSSARLRDAAIEVSGALSYARSEAIRTGNVHLVFYQKDASDTPLNDTLGDSGTPIEVLVVNDGRPGSINQNCSYDAGENIATVRDWVGIEPGASPEGSRVGTDIGTGDIDTGSSFIDPDDAAAMWVLFRPEGSPRSFNAACDIGKLGSGAGTFYLTNGARAGAVVMMPMGGTKIHSGGGQGWSL